MPDACVADAIAKALTPFTHEDDPDVVMERHSHWAVGHVDGFSVRVFRDGDFTDAFRTYHGLVERLSEYPILDESEYGEREYVATVENIADAAARPSVVISIFFNMNMHLRSIEICPST